MPERIRTIIIDDEPLARERIRTFIEMEPDFEIVAECGDGTAAIRDIDRFTPDLIFLDVQMPELGGFDVLTRMKPARPPEVIFVTAHDQYAVRAFEFHALDYLLKPYDRARFRETLTRARSSLIQRQAGASDTRLSELIDELTHKTDAPERLVVKSGGRILFLDIDEIDWIEASGNYVRFHIGNETHSVRETMGAIEQRLPSGMFVRIHRSTIVNRVRIKEMQPLSDGEYAVILKDGTDLRLSRSYRSAIDELT
jgi:two-component system LytT family response regulator